MSEWSQKDEQVDKLTASELRAERDRLTKRFLHDADVTAEEARRYRSVCVALATIVETTEAIQEINAGKNSHAEFLRQPKTKQYTAPDWRAGASLQNPVIK